MIATVGGGLRTLAQSSSGSEDIGVREATVDAPHVPLNRWGTWPRTVRICENMGKPASVAEAALSDWMAKFNNRVSWTRRTDCSAASDLLYWGRDNAYVDDYCDYVGAYACYDPYPTEWFAPRGRNVANDNALIVVAYSRLAGRTDAQAKHIYAHEFGHGMGLADHSLTDCSTVMGGQGCTTLPTWADTMTAAFNYVQ